MSNDLIFPIIPREGKVPVTQDEMKVQRIEKKERAHALEEEEEKALEAEERDAREKHGQKKQTAQQQSDADELTDDAGDDEKDGDKGPHLDIFV